MDRIRTDIAGGLPFDLPDLAQLQDTYEAAIEAIARATTAQNCILTGCELSSGVVSPGFVVLQGLVLYHPGTELPPNTESLFWSLNERVDNAVVTQLGETVESWLIREAIPAADSGLGGVWLPRWEAVSKSEVRQTASLIGEIKMWAGSLSDFDETGLGLNTMVGWAICNGANNTVDLRERFPAGIRPASSFDIIGKKLGSHGFTLSVANLPAHSHGGTTDSVGPHSHSIPARDGGVNEVSGSLGIISELPGILKTSLGGEHVHTFTTDSVGRGAPVNYVAQCTVVAFIQRVS